MAYRQHRRIFDKAMMEARNLKNDSEPSRPKTVARASKLPVSSGSDVIAFTDSINRGVLSEFFGAERNNSIRKLVIAAIECFAERGYRATTTRDIAKRAQMSPAALYSSLRWSPLRQC
jgi:hypothetical protein